MKVSVFDTYVKKPSGGMMHFDIIVPENTPVDKVFEFGKNYLEIKGVGSEALQTQLCNFCHVEHLQEHMAEDIDKKGYYILEMQGC
ncbi:MAG: DUF2024 family protein [Fulvivirga sp.]